MTSILRILHYDVFDLGMRGAFEIHPEEKQNVINPRSSHQHLN